MQNYVIIRDGKVTMRPKLTQDSLGRLWTKQGTPLLDGQADGAASVDLRSLVLDSDYDAIPDDCYAKVGEMPSGLVVMLASDYDRRNSARRDDLARKARQHNNVYNEGADGYNPYYHDDSTADDRTPCHKGDGAE